MTTPPLPKLISSETATVNRRADYERMRLLYERGSALGPRHRRDQRRPDRRRRNWAALIVDTVTSYMGDPMLSIGEDPDAQAAEQYLAEVYRAERLTADDYDTEVACAIDGDACWKVTWDDQLRRPRVVAVDPSRLYVQTRPDDRREVELFAEQYTLRQGDSPVLLPGQLLTLKPRETATVTEEWTADRWRIWLDNELAQDEPNPYAGRFPYIHFPNYRMPYRFWGSSDIARVEEPIEQLNAAEWDMDQNMALAGLLVTLSGVEENDDLAVAPGAIWLLPDDAKAEVLDVLRGNLGTQRLEYLQHLVTSIQQLSRTPATALGGSTGPSSNVSGIALQVQLGPIIRLVARKRRTRSIAYEARARLMLELAAMFGGLPESAAQMTPTVTWSETVPSDRREALEAAEAELRLGRDIAAVLRSIGVEDPEAEMAARQRQRSNGQDPSAKHEDPDDRTHPRPEPEPAAGR